MESEQLIKKTYRQRDFGGAERVRFQKNHRLILFDKKTTWDFTSNHVWFDPKPNVVSIKTTCDPNPNHVWFSPESSVV